MEWNEEQLSALVRAHRPAVRQALRTFTRDPEEIADLEQETFMRALVSLPSLREKDHFRPWVTAIARNLALGQQRTAGRERGNLRELAIRAEDREKVEIAEAGLIESALTRLPADTSRILRLYYFEGVNGKTIARQLGITAAAVRQRLSRGRNQLKEEIMDTVRSDDDLAEAIVKRLLETGKSLTERGQYQDAVDKFIEALNEISDNPLRATVQMPEDLRKAMSDAWGHVFQYHPPEEIQEPEGRQFDTLDDIMEALPQEHRGTMVGTLEDIGRILQVSPAWVYLWWKQGMPCWKHREDGIIRFTIGEVKQWLQDSDIQMPPKVDGEESYFLVKGIVYGLREGLLNPEDVEVLVDIFIHRGTMALYRRGSFSNLAQLGGGSPEETRQALRLSSDQLTDIHRQAVALRETWTPNCGYLGPYPYDRENAGKIAVELRQMKSLLQETAQILETAAASLEQVE